MAKSKITSANPFDYPPIPEHRRQLMLKICGSATDRLEDVTSLLAILDQRMQKGRLDAALLWLLTNGLTGDAFFWWFYGECHRSPLKMVQVLTSKIEGMPLRSMIAGKDII